MYITVNKHLPRGLCAGDMLRPRAIPGGGGESGCLGCSLVRRWAVCGRVCSLPPLVTHISQAQRGVGEHLSPSCSLNGTARMTVQPVFGASEPPVVKATLTNHCGVGHWDAEEAQNLLSV